MSTSDLVQRLLNAEDAKARLHAARDLSALGVKLRQGVLPRGTPVHPAQARLEDSSAPARLVHILEKNADEPLRQELLRVLGEWGDGTVVPAVGRMLRSSQDAATQRACVHALMTIGGPEALKGLLWAQERPDLGDSARWALEELKTGGTLDFSDGTTVRQPPPVQAPIQVRRVPVAAHPRRFYDYVLSNLTPLAVAAGCFLVAILLVFGVSSSNGLNPILLLLTLVFALIAVQVAVPVVWRAWSKSQTILEKRDSQRLNNVLPMLEEVMRADDRALMLLRASSGAERQAAMDDAIARRARIIKEMFQEYCGFRVAVTVKVLEQEDRFRTIFAAGVPKARIQSEPRIMPLKGSVSGRIFRSGETLVLSDAASASARETFEMNMDLWPDRLKHVRSLVGAPILVGGKVNAVLVIDTARSGVFQKTRATELLVRLSAESIGGLCRLGYFLDSPTSSPDKLVRLAKRLQGTPRRLARFRGRKASAKEFLPTEEQREFGLWMAGWSARLEGRLSDKGDIAPAQSLES